MKIGRTAYNVAGLTFVGIGFLGLVLPGLPATIFMILALFCFKKGSPKLESWLLGHKRFGPTLRDWEKNRAIKRRTKVIAISTMWAFAIVSIVIIPNVWVKVSLVAVCAWATWYIASRKSVEDLPVEARQSSETYQELVA